MSSRNSARASGAGSISRGTSAAPRVILITGASSGIGHACAAYLAARGYRVYGASRSALVPEGVIPLRLDVTDDLSVREACRFVLEREGRIDAVVNNAGMGIAGAIEDTPIEEVRRQFDVNFFGVVRVCRAVLPAMREARSGAIVNIGSIGGLIAIPFQGLYSASKFALEGFSEALRLEARPFGIRVVLIEPGDHPTSFTGNRSVAAAPGTAYRESLEHAVARMAKDEQSGPPLDGVARLVEKVIRARNPRLRYTVGPFPQRVAVWLKRLAPYAVIEQIMRRYYLP
jgi:NAD(P)-dependent dehydrogenase (short-subunit alcohol dehydrogenase family)